MYLLLNKDMIWAEFDVVNTYGLESIVINRADTTKIHPWITDLASFIVNRRAPKHRQHIAELLAMCGCDTIAGYLNVSHALSLNDTIWVKKTTENLRWADVSLYINSFNTTVAKIAFEGGLYGGQFSSTSPEFGTDGTFAKCWIREAGQIKLIKRGSDLVNKGIEPYSEYYASQILREFKTNHVDYELTSRKGKLHQNAAYSHQKNTD